MAPVKLEVSLALFAESSCLTAVPHRDDGWMARERLGVDLLWCKVCVHYDETKK